MFEVSRQKEQIRDWIRSQPEIPNRKALRKQFPDVPVKLLRSVLQSYTEHETSE